MSEEKKKEPKFKESEQLRKLAKEILAADSPELQSARFFKHALIFTEQRLTRHRAAYCRKLDGALSFKTSLDFLIVVEYDNFMRVKPLSKVQTIVHELYHITEDRYGNAAIREHWEDFCEIPSHDKFSRQIAERILDHLPTLSKIPFQTTLEEQGPQQTVEEELD